MGVAPSPRISRPRLFLRVSATFLGVLLLAFVVYRIVLGVLMAKGESNEREASAALKLLAAAEAEFRSHDRDANGIQDFWTADVRGLHDLVPPGRSEPIRLIPKEIAEADPSHPGATPFHGYWFVAMEKDDQGADYRLDTGGRSTSRTRERNPLKFGICAYPAKFGVLARRTFIISEGNTIFKFENEGRSLLRFPRDIELRAFRGLHGD